MIKARNLSKRYKDTLAVDNISFQVKTGEVTGFLGPNGAGKSTTMRLMLGLDSGGGQTTYDGKPLYGYARPSKVVGILLEAKAFHPSRTARNHLRVLAAAGGIPLSRVDEVLELVGLSSVAKKRPGKFSLGMGQRLGLAAAILGEPKYLILDEPANGLDPEGIRWLRQFLKNYAAAGNAVFVSSHLLAEMTQLADNVLVIARGKIIADKPVKDLLSDNIRSGILVRTPRPALLEKLAKQRRWQYEKIKQGLRIRGPSTDAVGRLAFKHGIPILELAWQNVTLEDIFLEMTEGKEEYGTHEVEGGKT